MLELCHHHFRHSVGNLYGAKQEHGGFEGTQEGQRKKKKGEKKIERHKMDSWFKAKQDRKKFRMKIQMVERNLINVLKHQNEDSYYVKGETFKNNPLTSCSSHMLIQAEQELPGRRLNVTIHVVCEDGSSFDQQRQRSWGQAHHL